MARQYISENVKEILDKTLARGRRLNQSPAALRTFETADI